MQNGCMKTIKFDLVCLSVLFFTSQHGLAADPLLTSWLKIDSEAQARIYRNDKDKANGTTVTTWNNGRLSQAEPVYPGVQQILSSKEWVYVFSTGLGSHIM